MLRPPQTTWFIILLLTLIIQRNAVYSQEQPDTHPVDSIRVDSIYQSLSITERMSQFLLINSHNGASVFDEMALEVGGVLLNETTAKSHLEQVVAIVETSSVSPLIFAELNEDLSINLEGVPSLGSKPIYQKLNEPHLFYESGLALAKQSKLLGISCLYPDSLTESLTEGKAENYWKIAELNQGLIDGGVMPLNAFRIVRFSDFTTDILKQANKSFLILIDQSEIPDFHSMLQEAIAMDSISMDALELAIKRIISVKEVFEIKPIEPQLQIDKLKNTTFYPLQFELALATIELQNNPDEIIPIKDLTDRKIALLDFNAPTPTFKNYLQRYTKIDFFKMDYYMSAEQFASTWNDLANHDLIICGFHALDQDLSKHKDFNVFLAWLDTSSKSIIADFTGQSGNLPALSLLDKSGIVISPEDFDIFHKLVPQVIFGGIALEEANGLSGSTKSGLSNNPLGRFAYTCPEAVGLKSDILFRIDSIAKFAIEEKATPGCQILVAKDNQVIYQKSFGYHTYDSLRAVASDDLYDLASVTKVSGALPGLMKLYEEGRFDLDATLGTYVKYFRRGNKKRLTFREILAHQSGLIPWIPYWQTAIRKNGKYRRRTLSTSQSEKYPFELTKDMYLHKSYKRKIYKQIRKSKVGEKKYLYSGLTFYIFPEIIEEITGQKYEDYIYNNFYKPLGATTLTYRPLDKFDIDRIVPTEYDSLFRKSQIHGQVHDEGAAMMEGISSNAGLFADANDLAKLWQMYCNYGEFGGKRYLKEETVKEFARCQYPENDNRRGLGFDRPMPEPHQDGNTAVSVSQSSFGHTGFTGTFAWADPEYNLVYIFLSNRVYPTRNNTKLYDLNIRTNIQQVIYDAMEK